MSEKADDRGRKRRWLEDGVLGAVCALVIGVYAYTAHEGAYTQPILDPARSYYNLLVQGFRAGQLNLKEEVPPVLAKLPDPYTYTQSRPGQVLDLSYYKGKLYLYFGVTPALLLFWPYVVLTGRFLFFKNAVFLCCAVGFLVYAGLLRTLWQRYFAEVNVGVVAAGILALGLATFIPSLLARCDVYEVAVSCGYALMVLALAAVWKALHEPERRTWWLATASLACGLAAGARPNLLFGSVILLMPLVQNWREGRGIWLPLIAATVPITLIGLGLMLYNVRRFDDPFEFGIRYQMTTRSYLHLQRLFGIRNLWANFRIYFLEPARWSRHFPFVHRVKTTEAFGVLTNIPFSWLALAAPLAWKGRIGLAKSVMWCFVSFTVLLFAMCVLPLGFYFNTSLGYEVEFLPALVLLAVIGVLALERALVSKPLWQQVVRWGWTVLLAFSVLVSLLTSVRRCAEAENEQGMQLQSAGYVQQAIPHFEQAVHLYPEMADAHVHLGDTVWQLGRLQEAIEQYQQALGLDPNSAEAHYSLGRVLAQQGRLPEAIDHWKQAVWIKPDFAEAYYGLGLASEDLGRMPEAIKNYEQALRIKPDFTQAQNRLAHARASE